MAGLENSNFG